MAVVKVENKTYTVDPLYQWDKNQELKIIGLSLGKVPEIHFSNTLMDRAIVRQARMNSAGTITTQVPNSLLQKASRITAYICTYEGNTFKTHYKVEIPVKARPMPADYTFEDDAGEVYSFNALENQVANALATLQAIAQAAQDSAAASAASAEVAQREAEEMEIEGNKITNAAQAAADAAKAAEQAAQSAADSESKIEKSILKSDIVEIKKVAELPENPVENVLYVIPF